MRGRSLRSPKGSMVAEIPPRPVRSVPMATEQDPERSEFSSEITITPLVRKRTVEDANAEVGLPLAMRLCYEDVPRRLQALAPFGIAVDVQVLFLDTIFDVLCPPGTEDRDEFVAFYNQQIETVLASAESNLNRMRLMQGVPGPGR